MSLGKMIATTHKEIAGSRAKNRLTVQISYAIQLIMEFYSTDFLVMMDYIEDVSIICNPMNPSEIHLYQVKTKSSDKQYSLSVLIKDEWYLKLYRNAMKYNNFVASAAVVCNTDVVKDGNEVFPNKKTSLEDKSIQKNIQKIKLAIANAQGINENDVELSKYYFIRSKLSTKGHKEEVEYEFENFLLKRDPELQVATVKSIYKLLYDQLDGKFNNEINENCTDINEIFDMKGIDGQGIKNMISCGLAIQFPSMDKLFFDFGITSVLERRSYATQFSLIKMDMYSNMGHFVEIKKTLTSYIVGVNQDGVDDMPSILEIVFEKAKASHAISEVYEDKYYLKMLIMILVFRYCYGGEQS